MARREPDRRSAARDRLAEPEPDGGDAVLGAERRRGIEVLRPGGAGDVRVEAPPVGQADHPLEDDGHLLLFLAVGSAVEEAAHARQEERRIDLLDGPRQRVEPRPCGVLLVRHQHRLVHPGEGLVGRVLEEARGAHRERVAHRLQEPAEVLPRFVREPRLVEARAELGLARHVERERQEVVPLHEAVEDPGRQHHRLGHSDHHLGMALLDSGAGQDRVGERQTARLAAHRPAADAEQTGVGIEALAGEVGHHRAAALPPALLEPAGHVAPHVVRRAVVADPHLAETARELQFPPRHQPVGDLVVPRVLHQHFVGHRTDDPLEGIEVVGARHLRSVGPAEHEVAEVEPVAHQVADPPQQVPRTLQQEVGADAPRPRFVFRTARVEDRGDIRTHLAHGGDEALARLAVGPALPGELDVRNHPEDLVGERREGIPRFLVVVAEEDLRPAADPVEFLREAQPFRDQLPGLLEDRLVHDRQERGVVADAVLDQQDGRDPEVAGVLGRVPLVLDVLHDRQEDADVALPDERLFEVAASAPREVLAYRAGVVAEERDRCLPPRLAEPVREGPDVHVAEIRRTDHQLEPVRGVGEAFEGLGPGRHLRHPRQDPEVQVEESREDPLVELAVLGEDERVVVAQHEEDFVDPEPQQIGERRRERAMERHGFLVSHSPRPPPGETPMRASCRAPRRA